MRLHSYSTTPHHKMNLEKKIQLFLKKTKKLTKPLLVGFSGGTDSLTLVHCLIQLKVPLHLAHFDHAWRHTSKAEASQLKKWAEKQEIPFHMKRSRLARQTELEARKERYAFFQELFDPERFEALALAHHRDDQVETILKRVFEGTHLTTLKGMRPIYSRGALPIWRPLLDVSKEEIHAYIDHHSLQPIEDDTNEDPHYLRARMRTRLIPSLSKEFGKEISSSLLRMGEYGAELEEYLESKTCSPVEGPFGVMWDFSTFHPIEIRYHVGTFFRKRELSPSQSVMNRILAAIASNRANHKVSFSTQILIVDRKRLFWLKMPLPCFPKEQPLQEGTIQNECWEWKIALKEGGQKQRQNWHDWWKGKISLAIPEGSYRMVLPNKEERKRQNQHQVPAFLRDTLPILRGKDIREFLTGRPQGKETACLRTVEVKIKREMIGIKTKI